MVTLLIVVVAVVLIILVMGGVDNDRPLSEWSDDKLVRMRVKLGNAANAHFTAQNMNNYKKYADKKVAVENEIIRREKAYRSDNGEEVEQPETLQNDESSEGVLTEKAFLVADAGDVKLQVLVGMSYLSGSHGLAENLPQASKYLLMAAKQNDAHAAFVVSGLYIEGMGFTKNVKEALVWAEKAKSLGHPEADDMLSAINAME